MKSDKKRKQEDAEKWLELVHGGTCCAVNDPQEEEKKQFINDLNHEKKCQEK